MTRTDIALFPREEDRYAGLISRASAFMLDIVIILLINTVINFTMRALFGFFSLGNVKYIADFNSSRLVDGLTLVFPVLLQTVYFIGAWSIFGRTIGMSVIGIRVEETNHPEDVTFMRAVLRYFGMYVSIIVFGLGFLWVLIDRRRQGWHDKLGNTVVVYSRSARRYHLKRMAAQTNAQKSESIAARSISQQ